MGTHNTGKAKLKGKIDRDSVYRKNGYNHIKGSGRANRYSEVDSIGAGLIQANVPPRSKKMECGDADHAKLYVFNHKKNFDSGYAPYANEAHHMLPVEAFAAKFGGKPLLTQKMRKLVKMSDYNVNAGTNMVFLPTTLRMGIIHQLPYHRGSHPSYTAMVVKDMSTIRSQIEGIVNADPDHKNWDPGDIAAKIRALEESYWDFLTSGAQVMQGINKVKKAKPKKKLTA